MPGCTRCLVPGTWYSVPGVATSDNGHESAAGSDVRRQDSPAFEKSDLLQLLLCRLTRMCRALRGGEICDEIPISKCLWPSYLLNQSQQASMVPLAFLHHFQVQPMREHLKIEQWSDGSHQQRKNKNKTKAHEMSVVNSAEPEFAGKPHHFHINNIQNVCFLCCVIIIASSSRLNVFFILHWFEFSTGGRMRGKKKQNMMVKINYLYRRIYFLEI